MNTQTQEALKMAIELMERFLEHDVISSSNYINVLQACKEALEQPSWQGLSEEEFIYFTSFVNAETLSEIEKTFREKNYGKV